MIAGGGGGLNYSIVDELDDCWKRIATLEDALNQALLIAKCQISALSAMLKAAGVRDTIIQNVLEETKRDVEVTWNL